MHRMTRTEHETQITQREHAKVCSFYITRLYDYQTWQTQFLRNSRGVKRNMVFFFLIVLLAASAGEANSDHMVFAFVLYTYRPLAHRGNAANMGGKTNEIFPSGN